MNSSVGPFSRLAWLAALSCTAVIATACASGELSTARDVDISVIPTASPSANQIVGSVVPKDEVNQRLISIAIADAKSILKQTISFHGAIKSADGKYSYIFLIERVDDNYLVYEADEKNAEFRRKFFYATMNL